MKISININNRDYMVEIDSKLILEEIIGIEPLCWFAWEVRSSIHHRRVTIWNAQKAASGTQVVPPT